MTSLNTCEHSKAVSIYENKNKKFNCSFLNVQYVFFFPLVHQVYHVIGFKMFQSPLMVIPQVVKFGVFIS
jgi:hypothetical protein